MTPLLDGEDVVLAVDVGSSGVRCLAYAIHRSIDVNDGEDGDGEADSSSSSLPLRVEALDGCSSADSFRVVEPATGRILGLSRGGGGGESSAVAPLLDRIDGCIDEVLGRLRDRYAAAASDTSGRGFRVVGVGFSTFVMNLVGVDDHGEVVVANDGDDTASISYACNAPEVADECRRLRSELGPDRLADLYRRTGAPLHSAYALPQLRTLYSDARTSEMASRVRRWQTVGGLCLSRWTCRCGRRRVRGRRREGGRGGGGEGGGPFLPLSYSEASWTGMLNFRMCEWDGEVATLLPERCRAALPDLADYHSDRNGLGEGIPEYISGEDGRKEGGDGGMERNPYWERWPEIRFARLFLGVGDGAAANVGSKCGGGGAGASGRRVTATIGTSAAARVVMPLCAVSGGDGNLSEDDDPSRSGDLPPPGLFCYRVDADRVLLGGALTDGGSAVEWARSLLNLSTEEDFQTCMDEVARLYERDAGGGGDNWSTHRKVGGGLTMIPFLSGERSTGFRDGARGCALGLTRDTTSADLLRSVLEGVVLRVRAVLKLLREGEGSASPSASASSGEEDCIVASGTALERNGLWRQMLADASGLPVVLDADSSDGTSRGVAVLVAGALFGAGGAEDGSSPGFAGEEKLVVSERAVPRDCAGVYWELQEKVQEKAIDAVSALWHS